MNVVVVVTAYDHDVTLQLPPPFWKHRRIGMMVIVLAVMFFGLCLVIINLRLFVLMG